MPLTGGREGLGNAVQPWPTVVIGQGNAEAHLLDIAGRVKFVAFQKGYRQMSRQLPAERRFTAAAHAHDDNRLGALARRLPPQWAPRAVGPRCMGPMPTSIRRDIGAALSPRS